MKKITISVAVLLGSISTKAQTEYIEVSNNKTFKRSFVCYYGDNGKPLDKDLECSVVKGKLNYHWVKYNNVKKLQIICADKENTYRKICVNDYCNIYDTNNQIYNFTLTNRVDSVKIYKPHYNE